MKVGAYQLTVPEGQEQPNGYVHMAHMQQYSVRMRNFSNRKCNASITIDGVSQGSYRINPNSTITLECSVLDAGKFTFLAAGTTEAFQAGESSVSKEQKGLVQVRFVPEKEVVEVASTGFECYRGPVPKGAGMTGLTGHSDQQFTNASHIEEDTTSAVTITLRLVAVNTVRPLPGRLANTVPPSVE